MSSLVKSPAHAVLIAFFFVLLGVSAAIWGGWLERAGPRIQQYRSSGETFAPPDRGAVVVGEVWRSHG